MKLSGTKLLLAIGVLEADAQRLRKTEISTKEISPGNSHYKLSHPRKLDAIHDVSKVWSSPASPTVYDFSGRVKAGDILIPQAICQNTCYRVLPDELPEPLDDDDSRRKLQVTDECPDPDENVPFCNGEEAIGDLCEPVHQDRNDNNWDDDSDDSIAFNNCRFEGAPVNNCPTPYPDNVDDDRRKRGRQLWVDPGRPIVERVACEEAPSAGSVVANNNPGDILKPVTECADDCFEVIPFEECLQCDFDNPVYCNGTQAIGDLCMADPSYEDECFVGININNCNGNDIFRVIECPSPSDGSNKYSKSSKSGGSWSGGSGTGSKSSKNGSKSWKSSASTWEGQAPENEWEGPPENEWAGPASGSGEAAVEDPVDDSEEDPIQALTDLLKGLLGMLGGGM